MRLDYTPLTMFGQGRRACAASVLVLPAALWSSRPALADEPGVSVHVDCPALGEERRAALESRANTELLVRRESGALSVSCSPDNVHMRWQPAAGDASEHRVPLAADAIATEEQILEGLEALLHPSAAPPAKPAPVKPPVSAAKPPETSRVEPAIEPKIAPVPPGPSAAGGVEDAPTSPPYFELLAGVTAELWSSEVGGAVGPGVRAVWVLPGALALSGGAAVVWTLRSPEDVSSRVVRIQVGGEYHLDRRRRWRLGAAVLMDLLHASRASLGVAETEDEHIFGGGLSVRYALLGPPLAIVLGPTISVRAAPVKVEIGQREVFSIPVVAPGFSAELSLGQL